MVMKFRKYGFSMLEATITMLLVAIFTAAATNIFTQKHTKVALYVSHGSFECYRNPDGQICQRSGIEGIYQNEVCGLSECSFKPSKTAEYYVVNAIGGGGGGYPDGYNGRNGSYRTFFVTSISKELKITPGEGGIAGTVDNAPSSDSRTLRRGKNTIITDTDANPLMLAEGGSGGVKDKYSLNQLKGTDIGSCALFFEDGGATALSNYPDCSPQCTISSASIRASYCIDNDTLSLPSNSHLFYDEDSNEIYFQHTNYMARRYVRMYLYLKDSSVDMFTPNTEYGNSKMDEYLDAAELTEAKVRGSGIGGRGGASAEDGSAGAVLIVW